jgi:hypothetical protein
MPETKDSSAEKVPSISKSTVILVIVAVTAAWILLGFILPLCFSDTWSEQGQFGDQFGSVNALFSGLAFAGLLIAILQQRIEIKQSKVQTQIMREELEALKGEQEQTQQLSALQIQATCYSTLLEAHVASEAGAKPGREMAFKSQIKPYLLGVKLDSIAEDARSFAED